MDALSLGSLFLCYLIVYKAFVSMKYNFTVVIVIYPFIFLH